MSEKCQRCGFEGEDRRTLWMACFYAMSELGLPFEQQKIEASNPDQTRTYFTLRVCKRCRADWMAHIKMWFTNTPTDADCDADDRETRKVTGTGIFIRELGNTRELTEEEVKARYPDYRPE